MRKRHKLVLILAVTTAVFCSWMLCQAQAARPLTDAEAGYDQAAYDQCRDSAEELSCE